VVKVERKPGSASRVTFVVLVMGLLVVGVVATLYFATQAAADAYKLEQAKTTTKTMSVRVDRLRQDVARQQSPLELAQKAQQLGMVPVGDPAVLVVGQDGKVTVVGTPSVAKPPPPPPPPPSTTAPPPTTTTTPPTTTGPTGR
jgi:hypothetical protein